MSDRLLIVDTENMALSVDLVLRESNMNVEIDHVGTLDEAREILGRNEGYVGIVIDPYYPRFMPGEDKVRRDISEFIKEKSRAGISIVVATSYFEDEFCRLYDLGQEYTGYFVKPFEVREFAKTIGRLLTGNQSTPRIEERVLERKEN